MSARHAAALDRPHRAGTARRRDRRVYLRSHPLLFPLLALLRRAPVLRIGRTVVVNDRQACAEALTRVPLDRTAAGTTGGTANRLEIDGTLFDQAGTAHRQTRRRVADGLGAAGVARQPRVDQVAAVLAPPLPVRVFGIRGAGREEVAAAAAEQHVGAVSVRGLDHLPGDVGAAGGLRRRGQLAIAFPVAIGGMGEGRSRCGVGGARGGDHPGAHAGGFRQFPQGQHVRIQRAGTIAATRGLADADHPGAGLHPGGHRRHRAGRVGGLGIGVVGLAERGLRPGFPGQPVAFAGPALALAVEDPRGSHRRQAHAVADEQDQVARASVHRAARGRLRGAVAEPPRGGFAIGMADRGHGDDGIGSRRRSARCRRAGTRCKGRGKEGGEWRAIGRHAAVRQAREAALSLLRPGMTFGR